MTTSEAKARILSDPDFVNLPKYDYSIKNVLEKYPDGNVPDRVIAQALLMTEDDVETVYASVVAKLRRYMKVQP